MPNKTPNLALNTWLENEGVNFEEVNANFEKLDGYVMCIESGTITSNYSGGATGVATWRYKKYSDKTVEMSTKLVFTNLKCNGGSKSPYYSGASKVYFPFKMSEVYDLQLHLASNTIGWVADIHNVTISDCTTFRVMAVDYEDDYIFKQVFVHVKGVIG